MAKDGVAPNLFINRESGAIAKVTSVDAGYAYIEVVWPAPGHYSMPIADYDGGVFGAQWRPPTAEEVRPADGNGFRLPATIPADWDLPPTSE